MDFTSIYKLILYYSLIIRPDFSLAVTDNILGEEMDFHIYKLEDNFVFDSNNTVNNVFSLCKNIDTSTQIIIGKNITIDTGVTLTPPYRCKGLIIYDSGTLKNLGTISMYCRGCFAKGQNIYLYENDFVPAIGANGGIAPITDSLYNGGINFANGNAGQNGINRASGGGGSGSIRNYVERMYAGNGGQGTSYSGGTGGGAACTDRAVSRTAGSGNNNGGSGGHGAQGGNYTGNSGGDTNGWGMIAGGGQGNNPGNNVWCSHVSANVPSGQPEGTGGLLVIYCYSLNNQGNINANGVTAKYTVVTWSYRGYYNLSGGSSGGGSLNIYYENLLNQGVIQSIGGASQWQGMTWAGGKGGNGNITLSNIKIDKIKNIQYRKNSNFYKDTYYQEHFDFQKLLE